MRPILFTIFGFPIRSYGLFIAIAFTAALWLALTVARKRGRSYEPAIEDFALWAFFSAIIGARLWEVVFSWDYYGQHLSEIVMIWKGGISIQGAIVGGLVAGIFFTRSRKLRSGTLRIRWPPRSCWVRASDGWAPAS